MTCTVCSAPTDVYLCATHRDELVDNLRVIAGTDERLSLVEELNITVTRQAKTSKSRLGIVVSGGGEKPLMFHEGASNARHLLCSTVAAWAKDFAKTNPHLEFRATTIVEAAAWMARFPSLLAQHPEADKMHDEIRHVTRKALGVIDIPKDRRIYLGPCKEIADGKACEGEVFAKPGADTAECPACHVSWGVMDRRDWLAYSHADKDSTPAELSLIAAAMGYQVSPAAIRAMADRGELEQAGWRKVGKVRKLPTYRVGDLMDILMPETKEKAA